MTTIFPTTMNMAKMSLRKKKMKVRWIRKLKRMSWTSQ